MKTSIYLILISFFLTSCNTHKELSISTLNNKAYNFNLEQTYLFHRADSQSVNEFINSFNTYIYWTKDVETFYQNRSFKPVWQNAGSLNNYALELTDVIRNAEYEGLFPSDYNMIEIMATINKIETLKEKGLFFPSLSARLDILLTHAYMNYASDLLSGKINPNSLEVIWEAHPRSKNLVECIELAIEKGQIKQSLEELNPHNPQYALLKKKLKELLNLRPDEKWHHTYFNSPLSINDTNEYVFDAKLFLTTTGDLTNRDIDLETLFVFDKELEESLKRFQYRHGLEPDGIMGKKTIAQMNKSLDYRINQIKINMERLRWLPENLGQNYVKVNLPEYTLRYFENDYLKKKMKVIIGKYDNYTPILTDTIDYIEFNPRWNVPYSIATKTILPKVKRDPSYLTKNNYTIIKGHSGKALHPDSIDWRKINENNFPFRIIQQPGEKNALGLVKFIFPNEHAIYIHDTPSDYLFNKFERDFSHGCIRLEKPIALAENILNSSNHIDRDTIEEYLKNGKPRRVFLKKKVKVYFTYQTAWVDNNNKLHFRDDVYDFDDMHFSLAGMLRTLPKPIESNNIELTKNFNPVKKQTTSITIQNTIN